MTDITEMDIEAFLNIRDWLEMAIMDKGGVITDGGIGVGRADIGFTIDGMPFDLQLKPRSVNAVVNLTFEPNNIPVIRPGKIVYLKDEPE